MATEDIEVQEIVEDNDHKRCCDNCGKEYAFKSKKSKFCSEKCRGLFGVKQRKKKLNGTPQKENAVENNDDDFSDDQDQDDDSFRHQDNGHKSITKLSGSLRGLDAQAQYIITHQQAMINDLKAVRRRLEDKLEEATRDRNQFEKKLDKIELEQSLNLQAKSGLNGISENPIVLKLVEHTAPALGAWLQKMMEGPPASQLTGAENFTPEVQQQIFQISNWYGQQSPETQQTVFNILDVFADTEPEKLPMILKRVTNIIKNGTATSNGHASIFPN